MRSLSHSWASIGLLAATVWIARSFRARFPRLARLPGARAAFHTAQDLDRAILDAFPTHICIIDESGTVRIVNRAWREFAKSNPPVLSNVCEGANYLDVCDRARAEPTAAEVGKALRSLITGRAYRFCTEYPCHAPWQERWFTARAYRYLDHGAVRVLVTHEAITAQKLAERTAKEREDRYRAIVEEALDGFYALDLEGRFALVNRATSAITGYPREELIGMHATRLFPPEDHERFYAIFKKLREGGIDQSEWCIIRKDGQKVYVEVRAHARDDGQIVGFARDVTERREAEKLRRSCATAEAANRAKDRFLAMLSHELRTPLAPVLSATRMIEEDPDIPSHVRDLATIIYRNVEVQVYLIDELLDQTRITRGKLKLHSHALELRDAVNRALETLSKQFEGKRLQLRVQLEAERTSIWGDAARVQQILLNLLQNAVKFTPPEGLITVRVWNPVPQRVRVAISDTGIGIEPAILPRLFQPFEQGGAHTTHRFGGLGLGLTISKELAELHGGTLTAHSEGKDRGSTFEVEFPLTSTPREQTKGVTPPRQELISAQALRILLVEDHADTARILGRLLERRGHHVHISYNVHEAEESADAEPFDLVLSDIDLPDGTGYDLMEHLRSTHPVPGISLSGFGMEQDVKRSREAGFAEHLVKPVEPRRLEEAIAHVATASRVK